ncbi:hypothetical protein [Thiomicrorhabdus sp.]|uniref:hypothetical protein n=1 Tax=Thiomicrorhabdus sp. TaxID=2039724 RepID=UPI002AA7ACB2|nr:hypothetical protein [Thiomicrorhabdus sp.]
MMKPLLFLTLILHSWLAYANDDQTQLLKQFHEFGITHCDEFISKNTATPGVWKFFMSKHPGGIDGPSTEVSLTQISGKPGQSFKTDYTFIQTLKQCFLHKSGQIVAFDSCAKAVDSKVWNLQYKLPEFDYERYKDKKGVILFTKEIAIDDKKICLLNYEFRTQGKHSIYKKIDSESLSNQKKLNPIPAK